MKKIVRTPEDNQKAQLENEVARLNKKIAKYEALELKQLNYGLVWLDVPEAFEDDVENKLPILEEVPKLAINSKDGKPTHLLIEGDNYHALTCLNYTHKGKVDVIYIDPPYNTGSDGFKYKDKRFLKEYPDGTEVPIDHPLRHSYWLSFMKKRLELAKDILKDAGVIFISIDDNEYAQLKLLCDEIFGEKNFIQNFMWLHGKGKKDTWSRTLQQYILCYAKDKSKLNPWIVLNSANYNYQNPDNDKRGAWFSGSISFSEERSNKKHKNYFEIKSPSGIVWKRQWQCSYEEMKDYLKQKKIFFGLAPKYDAVPRIKIFPDDISEQIPSNIIDGVGTTREAQKSLDGMFGEKVLDYPKPVGLIRHLLDISFGSDDILVLDFFAGSGTTGEAVLELNKKDNGRRRFILITNNDEITNGKKHKIMSDVCYPRVKNIIRGYNGNEGLGNSIRYFKAAFVGKNSILKADDRDKIELAHNAGGMLAIAENTFEQVEKTDHWQIFENGKQYTAVYFREEFTKYEEFEKKVKSLKKLVVVYIFSWEKELEFSEFEDEKNITVKTIPQPILEIYKQIYNLV